MEDKATEFIMSADTDNRDTATGKGNNGKNRGRAYYRKVRARKIASKHRKFLATVSVPRSNTGSIEMYKSLGGYSKNKIHCSCKLCTAKSNRDGYKASDLRKLGRVSIDTEDIETD